MISSMHNDSEVHEELEKRKPEIVMKYNATKGGVDTLDQMAHSFSTKRKSRRWPMVYFYNILDLSSVCARVIYKLKYPNDELSRANSRQRFNIHIGRKLDLPHIKRRQAVPQLQDNLRNNMNDVMNALEPQQEGRKQTYSITGANKRKASKNIEDETETKAKERCHICPARICRKTRLQCDDCKKHMCGELSVKRCRNCSRLLTN